VYAKEASLKDHLHDPIPVDKGIADSVFDEPASHDDETTLANEEGGGNGVCDAPHGFLKPVDGNSSDPTPPVSEGAGNVMDGHIGCAGADAPGVPPAPADHDGENPTVGEGAALADHLHDPVLVDDGTADAASPRRGPRPSSVSTALAPAEPTPSTAHAIPPPGVVPPTVANNGDVDPDTGLMNRAPALQNEAGAAPLSPHGHGAPPPPAPHNAAPKPADPPRVRADARGFLFAFKARRILGALVVVAAITAAICTAFEAGTQRIAAPLLEQEDFAAVPHPWSTWGTVYTSPGGDPTPVPLWIDCENFDVHNCSAATMVQALVTSNPVDKHFAAVTVRKCARRFHPAGCHFPVAINFLTRHLEQRDPADTESVEILLGLLPAANHTVRGITALTQLARLLQNDDYGTRVTAAKALRGVVIQPGRLTETLGLAKPLVHLLSGHADDGKIVAAETLKHVVEMDSAVNRKVFEKAGALPALTQLLLNGSEPIQQAAAGALIGFSEPPSDHYKQLITDHGALQPLLRLIKKGTNGARATAMATLATLADLPTNAKALRDPELFSILVELLGGASTDCKNSATTLLRSLTADVENKRLMVQAGAVPHLIQLALDESAATTPAASWTLKRLLTISAGETTVAAPDAIPALVEQLKVGSEARQFAVVGIFRDLLTDGTVVKLIVDAGAVPLLAQLWARCSEAVQGSAVMALRRLMENSEVRMAAITQLRGLVANQDELTREAGARLLAAMTDRVQNDEEFRKLALTAGVLPPVVEMLRRGAPGEKEAAVEVLRHFCSDSAVREACDAEGATQLLLAALSNTLLDGTESAKLAALETVQDLWINSTEVVEHRVIPAVLQLLSNATEAVRESALELLGHLAWDSQAANIMVSEGIIPALTLILGENQGKVYSDGAVSVLSGLVYEKGAAAQIVVHGLLIPLVQALEGHSLHPWYAMIALKTIAGHAEYRNLVVVAGALPALQRLSGGKSCKKMSPFSETKSEMAACLLELLTK
jgi:hypothetical protein